MVEHTIVTKKFLYLNVSPLYISTAFIGATASGGSSPKNKRVPPLKINGKDHLPFQLQIEYTGKDGSRCVRVLTQAKPVTKDRDLAEKG